MKNLIFRVGFENIVRILIENGADANVSDQFGYTSLHYAAKGGNIALSKWMTISLCLCFK